MAAHDLQQLLAELLEPDSDVIRRATARLREAFADPETPARLGLLLKTELRPQIRQLAAVLLRRRLLIGWKRLDPLLRERLPALVAEVLEEETDPSVALALAQLGALLLQRGGLGAWRPLGNWVQAAARDSQIPRQEVALRVLQAALAVAPEALATEGPALVALCKGFLDPGGPPGPTVLALQVLGELVATLGDSQRALLQSLVPPVLMALRGLLLAPQCPGAAALEILDELVEASSPAVIPHLRPLLELCLQVAGDASQDDAVRVRALATITFVAQKCPKALLRGGLLAPLLGGLLAPLFSEPTPGHPDPEEEEEEEKGREGQSPSPRHAAAQVLDALAQGLPPEKLLQQLVPLLGPALTAVQRSRRKGALLALAALEGAGEALGGSRFRGPVLGALRGGLGDPESCVRGAAALALRKLAPFLQPEAAELAAEALPGALGALEGGGQDPPAKSWFILESLVETLGPGVSPLLPQLLRTLLGTLEPSRTPQSLELGLSLLHCLVASVPGEQLQPHLGLILGSLSPLIQPGPPQSRSCRLQALGVLGALGPLVGEGLVAALELGLALSQEEPDDPDGRRLVFVLAGAVAEARGEAVGPLLPQIVPLLLETLRKDPPRPPMEVPDWLRLFEEEEPEEGVEPMDSDVSEEDELVEVEVGGAFVEELQDGCEALGELAEHSRSAFQPYLEPSLEALAALTQFPGAGLRRAAFETVGSLVVAMGMGPCAGHAPCQVSSPLLDRALELLVLGVREDPFPEGALGALGALRRLLGGEEEGTGPALGPPQLLPIGQVMVDVIKGEISCLEEDDEEDEDEDEVKPELWALAGEGLVALGGALAEAFVPLLAQALPPLTAGLAQGSSVGHRSWAAATLGQLGGVLGGALLAPLLPTLGRVLGAAAGSDPHPEVRSNSLWALGKLAETAGSHLDHGAWPGLAAVTQALTSEGRGRARDNACGALAKHGGAVPAQVVPLLLRALPLLHDPEEELPVAQFLLERHRDDPQLLLPHTAELPRACGKFLGSSHLPSEVQLGIRELLLELWGCCPTAFEEGLRELPHDDGLCLRQLLLDPQATSATPK